MSAIREAMSHAVLGWVKPELDETLRLARQEVESFVEEPADTTRMNFCAGYLHQVQGTLRMVELYAPAMVAEELELLARALESNTTTDRDEACSTLMRGTVLLPDYLERLQDGHRDIPIVLLPLLNDIRAARGESGLSESVLFAPDLEQPLPHALPLPEAMPWQARKSRVGDAQAQLELAVGAWTDELSTANAAILADTSMRLLENVEPVATRRMLWVAGNVAEAMRDGALEASPALRQAYAGVAREVRVALNDGGIASGAPSQEPTRQLLYLVSQAGSVAHASLDSLRSAFNLDADSPSEAEIDHARGSVSGRNRALLDTVGTAVKEELLRIKDALDLHLRTGAELGALQTQVVELGNVADTLGMMGLGVARGVVVQQRDALSEMVQGMRPLDEGALLDIAGALLYVDASLDDQVSRLGQSDGAAADETASAESRRTLEALAQEAIHNFGRAREGFVAFIETNWDHAQLQDVPRLLSEVGGAMRMLELPQPAEYLQGVRSYVAIELIGKRRVPGGQQLDTLADAMASLEYYLEALRERRPNREEILDITRSSLEKLRYWPLPAEAAAVMPVEFATEQADEVPAVLDEPYPAYIEPLEMDALDHASVPAVAQDATQRSAFTDPPRATAAASATGAALSGGFQQGGSDIDDEIREVFLEEFEEEIANLEQLLPQWATAPDDMERLRSIRRVFHTLKGSGRLVGAQLLGEFTRKIENMLNRVLDGSRPPSAAVTSLLQQATDVLPQLHAALRGHGAVSADLLAMQAFADRVAAGEEAFYLHATAAPAFADVDVDAGQGQPPEAEHEFVGGGTPASVDSVLREILEVEVSTHLDTVDAWLLLAHAAPAAPSEALVRALHTMNGAFAMASVPEITEVTSVAEHYVKRLQATGEHASAEGVAALGDSAAAIRRTMAGLRANPSRVPPFAALAVTLASLRDGLPEAASTPLTVDDSAQDTFRETFPDIAAPMAIGAWIVGSERVELTLDDMSAYIDADASADASSIGAASLEEPVETEAELTVPEAAAADAAEATVAAAGPGAEVEATPVEADETLAEDAQTEAAVEAEAEAQATADEAEAAAAEEAALDRGYAEAVAADETVEAEAEAEAEAVQTLDAQISTEVADSDAVQLETDDGAVLASVAATEIVQAATDGVDMPAELAPEQPAVEAGVVDIMETGTTGPDDSVDNASEAAAAQAAAALPDDALDFAEIDHDLVDIFVEEGNDLLDHSDGLLAKLGENPEDLTLVTGLQRDLHTIKGGARMAGINAVGDLGHAIESLLEQVAAQRVELDRGNILLLERGFDSMHGLVAMTGAHRKAPMPTELIAEFEQRANPGRKQADAVTADTTAASTAGPAVLAPLSDPFDNARLGLDDAQGSAGQEQVRVRSDLLDRLVNNAGEVAIYRSRLEQQLGAFRGAMAELDRTNTRLHDQLRRLDLETEAQIVARYQREQDKRDPTFDPLELDRFSTLQQLSRALAESAADLTGLQGVLDELARQYDSLLQQQSRVSSELQDGLMRARMVPFDGIVPRLRRVLRQAATDTNKQVKLQLDGAHGELDRNVLERMTAPLEHLLRNAVAHGLETPKTRRKAGKPEEGTVQIALRREGAEMVLQVSDDGTGINHAAIRRRAEQRGLVQPDAVIADVALERMILESGFSTSDNISQLAGRGVGMDVVYSEVRQLGGSLEIATQANQGTTFTLRLPQTLAVTQAVFVQIGETQFAVPVAAVGGVGRIARDRFETEGAVYVYGGEEYALHDLGRLVGQPAARAEGQPQVPLLLVRAGDLRAAVAVDQVLGNREIVVKPVGPQIASVPGIYGATITGDGRIVVILDVAPLVRRHILQPRLFVTDAPAVEERRVPLVMVVDDSLTMRKVTGRVLERHNFEVAVARDGIEALERLEEKVPDLMLLDIEMPRMDGYELATAMKADPRFKDVPIVMITSRTGEKHRQRAMEIGVQRYMGKPYQELDLMRNVYDLLGIARVRE